MLSNSFQLSHTVTYQLEDCSFNQLSYEPIRARFSNIIGYVDEFRVHKVSERWTEVKYTNANSFESAVCWLTG